MDARAVAVSPSEAEWTQPFDAFYAALFAPLFRSMLLLSGSRADAEDLTHEAFVRVLERWESVSRMQAPDAYLFRTALNLERNRLRRALRRVRKGPEDRDVQQDFTQEVIARADLLRLLQRLPREQREAIVLVDILSMTSEGAGRVGKGRCPSRPASPRQGGPTEGVGR